MSAAVGPSTGRGSARRPLVPLALAGAAAATLAAATTPLGGRLLAVTPGCPIRAVTGLDCPGCGTTRALVALARGDVALAADHNVVTLLLVPVLLVVWVQWLAVTLGRRAAVWQPPSLVVRALPVLIVGWWVVRNLPGPFAWLASSVAVAAPAAGLG